MFTDMLNNGLSKVYELQNTIRIEFSGVKYYGKNCIKSCKA